MGGHLSIEVVQSGEMVTLHFTDSGMGMNEAVKAQLFEPFFSTKHSGSGLGLAVSHDIITAHGGTLTASSQPGHGATFTVRLPGH